MNWVFLTHHHLDSPTVSSLSPHREGLSCEGRRQGGYSLSQRLPRPLPRAASRYSRFSPRGPLHSARKMGFRSGSMGEYYSHLGGPSPQNPRLSNSIPRCSSAAPYFVCSKPPTALLSSPRIRSSSPSESSSLLPPLLTSCSRCCQPLLPGNFFLCSPPS